VKAETIKSESRAGIGRLPLETIALNDPNFSDLDIVSILFTFELNHFGENK
jgi:hypothetical protein